MFLLHMVVRISFEKHKPNQLIPLPKNIILEKRIFIPSLIYLTAS